MARYQHPIGQPLGELLRVGCYGLGEPATADGRPGPAESKPPLS